LWINDYKRFSDYDANRNLISEGNITWSIEYAMWYGGYRAEYEYNENHQKITDSRFHYDPWYPKWIGDIKYYMEYEGDLMSSKTIFNWVINDDTWIEAAREEYQYDAQKHRTAIIFSQYDLYSQEWNYISKTEYYYNVSGENVLLSEFIWTGDAWSLKQEDSTIYIEDAEIEMIIILSRSSDAFPWDSVRKTEIYLDDVSGKTEKLVFQYITNSWFPVNKTITRNDENGSYYYESYTWDEELQSYTGIYIMEILYNDQGRYAGFSFYIWSEENNEWTGTAKETVRYYDFGMPHSVVRYLWDTNTKDWIIDYKSFNYYSQIIHTDSPSLEFKSSEVLVYPNPARDILYIASGNLQGNYPYYFYDISGKLISSGTITAPSAALNVSEFENGLYILKLGDHLDLTTKILIRK
jgi:hypothetical protein